MPCCAPSKIGRSRPWRRWLARSLHPNTLSLIGFAAGLGCAATLAFGPIGLSSVSTRAIALTLWLLGRVIDGLDGAVARRQGRPSDLGGYLDIMLDFIVYALVPIAAVFGATSSLGFYARLGQVSALNSGLGRSIGNGTRHTHRSG